MRSLADLRRRHGLYETPGPLVGYVVRSVHSLLQSRLGRPAGLADLSVRVLDPAAGPMNFVAEACRQAVAEHRLRSGAEGVGDLVRRHLVPHFLGFELLRRPYLTGHLAMEETLHDLGAPLADGERVRLYQVDSLADPSSDLSLDQSPRPRLSRCALARCQEAEEALRIRAEEPIPVVLGNPPYRGSSENRGRWICDLLRDYFAVAGEPLGERNRKWLQDDSAKFLRLAQWKIEQNGEGIVGFVINHNGLDAPTFRGLRSSLLQTFEEIYALDLHGNGRKRERCPDGRRDENVFPGVGQGVAVLLLVKRPGLPRRVLRADLYGTRAEKLRALAAGHVGTTDWQEVRAGAPAFLFLSTDASLEREYGQGLALPEIFPRHGVGVVTGQDAHLTALSRRELVERVGESRRLMPYLARPFGVRYLLYDPRRLARPRVALMKPMLSGDNLGVVACRQCREEPGAFVTRWMPGHKAFSAYDGSSLFPLYLASRPPHRANLSPTLCLHLAGLYGEVPSPEAILGYVYAVLWSPVYRARFRDLLRRDFPRVPFPRGDRLFAHLSRLGEELVALHLLRDPRLVRPAVRRVGDRSFEGIAPEIWEVRIGGYPVLRSWLRTRAGRVLSAQEVLAFRRAATALALTSDVQRRIDEVWCDGEITALRAA